MYSIPEVQQISDIVESLKKAIIDLFEKNLSDTVKIEENDDREILFKSPHNAIIRIYLNNCLLTENKLSISIEPKGTKGRDTVFGFNKIDLNFFQIIKEMIKKSDSWQIESLKIEDLNERRKAQYAFANEFGILVENYDNLLKGY